MLTFVEYEVLSTLALLALKHKKPPAGDIVQADIEALGLQPSAKHAAYLLRQAFGSSVQYTSGKRSIGSQASAMATNVIKSGNRSWVADTYKASAVSSAVQQWINQNPGATSQAALTAGILSVLQRVQPSELKSLSLHLVGQAFDVHVVSGVAGKKILAGLHKLGNLPGCKFLNGENGVAVWHLQIPEPTTLPVTL